jgi:hypothetical protein
LVSQFTVKAMAKKMAKSKVGKSMRPDQLAAPNVLPPRAAPGPRILPDRRARTPAVAPGGGISSWL